MTLVSVIIPTFNRAGLVPRAIRSVLAQTHTPIEILVVDDGSSDDTERVIRELAIPRLRYIRHSRNQGQCAAINTGILASKGAFVCFLDSDDEYRPEMIERQLAVFAQHDDRMGVVYTHAGALQPDGSLAPSHISWLQGRIYGGALAQGHVAHSIAMLVRRSCFDRIGMFDVAFATFQDDDICFRLAKEYEFGLVPDMLAVIHTGAGNRLTSNPPLYAASWVNVVRKYETDILRECGPGVLAKHWFRAGVLHLDAAERRAAFGAFSRAFRLARSTKSLGGMLVSLLPFPHFWVAIFRARRARRPALGTRHSALGGAEGR